MKHSKTSAIIVGSGIAGLYAALKLEQKFGMSRGIMLVTKSGISQSNSYYAQGGMVAVLKSNPNDSIKSHTEDTLIAGAGLSEPEAVRFIGENSDKVVKDLLTFGVDFDRDENGDFKLTKEAAHSVRRILHSGGDATGREMEIALCKAVQNNKNIKVLENTAVVELLVNNEGVCGGVVLYNREGEYEVVYSDVVIMATGGLGQLYKYTTNPGGATGDGIALCYNAGALMRDTEFVQFHPSALAVEGMQNRFLISEALRGEGAKLCDAQGVEFMEKYHPKKELAPRDIVARSIFREMEKNNVSNVFLNAVVIGKDKLIQRFPTIRKKCSECGIDITKDLIPVAPAAHYFMGGVKTDLKGATSVKGLYAIGEVASTGLHGGNRLASNSLLECVVSAYEIAEFLENAAVFEKSSKGFDKIIEKYELPAVSSGENVEILKSRLREVMWNNVGIFRTEESLSGALAQIKELSKIFGAGDKCATFEDYEFRNMLICAELIIKSALRRKESRGAHYRLDYLGQSEEAKHCLIIKNKGEISFVE